MHLLIKTLHKIEQDNIAKLLKMKAKLKAGDWLAVNHLNQPLYCESKDMSFFAGVERATIWNVNDSWTKKYHTIVIDANVWVDITLVKIKLEAEQARRMIEQETRSSMG